MEVTAPNLLYWCRLLQSAGSETILPAGCRLADEHRPGRYCFLLLDGSAAAEAGGQPLATFSAGSFIGSLDERGRPSVLGGITVRAIEPAHALVLDARKLRLLLDSDRALAAAWLRHKPVAARPGRSRPGRSRPGRSRPRPDDQPRVPAMSRAAI
jgi:CRP-like cAMP-binding protein